MYVALDCICLSFLHYFIYYEWWITGLHVFTEQRVLVGKGVKYQLTVVVQKPFD